MLWRFKCFLWYFSHFKVPLMGVVKPKLLVLDDTRIVIKIPLKRYSKNHLNSMYFGALAIGADIAGGLHGYYHAKRQNVSISLAFKSFKGAFIRRPQTDVYFISQQGQTIARMIQASMQEKRRINQHIPVQALIHYDSQPEEVANFLLELSIKVL